MTKIVSVRRFLFTPLEGAVQKDRCVPKTSLDVDVPFCSHVESSLIVRVSKLASDQ